jgi:hypothetical protein
MRPPESELGERKVDVDEGFSPLALAFEESDLLFVRTPSPASSASTDIYVVQPPACPTAFLAALNPIVPADKCTACRLGCFSRALHGMAIC